MAEDVEVAGGRDEARLEGVKAADGIKEVGREGPGNIFKAFVLFFAFVIYRNVQ